MTLSISRRTVLAAATAASFNRILGANDRIHVGIIGAGGRGTFDMSEVAKSDLNAEIAGVCDVWRPNRERECSPAPTGASMAGARAR